MQQTQPIPRIYTSYWAKTNALRKAGIVPIGISVGPPKWYDGFSMFNLAPHRWMLSKSCSHDRYILEFANILLALDPHDTLAQILKFGNGKPVALLCWEKPGDFCHRHIVAKWFNQHLDLNVREWRQPPKKPKYQQLSII